MKTVLSLFILAILPSIIISQDLSPSQIRERIDKATPAELPQSPRVAKSKSDAEDEHLKGKVRSVTEADLETDGKTLKLSLESFYDKEGALTKEISYDYRGNPWSITVYGYLDGKRVSNSAEISYEYDPPPAAPPPGTPRKVQAPADKRYEYSDVYKYDGAKRLIEKLLYRSNGSLVDRRVYSYSDSNVELVVYDESGKENSRTIEKYDSKGDLIEATYPHVGNRYGTSIYHYKYDEFDSHGNWVRRTLTGKEGQYGGSQKDFQGTEIRTITYY
jgi:hypothetical protein